MIVHEMLMDLKKVYGKSETTFFDELGLDQSKVTLQKRIENERTGEWKAGKKEMKLG